VPIEVGTRLRAVDPRLRLAAVVAACGVAVSASSPRTPLALFLFACAGLRLQGLSTRAILSSLTRIAWVFGLAVALKLTCTPGEPVFAGAPFPLDRITREGASGSAHLAIRIMAASTLLRGLSVAVQPAEIEAALLGLGVPRALVELLAFARRFTQVLARTAATAWSAAALRSGFARARTTARSVGVVAGVVMLRMLDRTERVATAMRLRGYRGKLALPARPHTAPGANLAFAAFAGAALALSVVAGGSR
jgi:cobalt/nickel transport system permease protein